MSWEGVAASTVTYNCVLDACANGGNPQRAAELFQEMKDRKVGKTIEKEGGGLEWFCGGVWGRLCVLLVLGLWPT